MKNNLIIDVLKNKSGYFSFLSKKIAQKTEYKYLIFVVENYKNVLIKINALFDLKLIKKLIKQQTPDIEEYKFETFDSLYEILDLAYDEYTNLYIEKYYLEEYNLHIIYASESKTEKELIIDEIKEYFKYLDLIYDLEKKDKEILKLGQLINIYEQSLNLLLEFSNLERILSLFLENAINISSAEVGSIMLESANILTTQISWGLQEEHLLKLKKDNIPLYQYAYNTGDAQVEVLTEEKQQKQKIFINNYIAFPIKNNDKVLGVLNLVNIKGDIEEVKFNINSMSNLASIAIQNAFLHTEVIKKQKMEHEILLAKNIQESMLPQELPEIDNYELFGRSIPAKEVGGDYFDFYLMDNRFLWFIIADVSGKGVPAGLVMAMTKTLFRIFVNQSVSVEELVKKMNKALYEDIADETFVTVIAGKINIEKNILEVVNAGNEPGILKIKNEFKEIESSTVPMGITDEIDLEVQTFILEQNDYFLIYTDGLTDARNIEREFFTDERLKQICEENIETTASDLGEKIYKQIEEFTLGAIPHDDITCIIIQKK